MKQDSSTAQFILVLLRSCKTRPVVLKTAWLKNAMSKAGLMKLGCCSQIFLSSAHNIMCKITMGRQGAMHSAATYRRSALKTLNSGS